MNKMGQDFRKWLVLVAVGCGTYMATLDASIVNIALPTLGKALGADLIKINWVILIYYLVITCLLLPFGRLSDIYGRKLVFFIGFLVFTLGSTFCGTTESLVWLIFSRFFQGLGGAMLMANGPAIITAAFPKNERGKALGTLAMIVSVGLISGPGVGGLLISHFGWRSIFLINIPFGLLGMFLVKTYIENDISEKVHPPFDWLGTILQMFILFFLIVLFDPPNLSVLGQVPFEVSRLGIFLIVLSLTVLFFRVEQKAEAPLFDLSLIKNRTFFSANLASFLVFIAYSTVSVLLPFFLEEKLLLTTNQSGILMTAIPLAILIVAPLSGRLSDQIGCRGLSFSGAAVLTCGLFVLSGIFGVGLHEDMNQIITTLMLFMIGLGMGLFQAPNNNAIMGSVPLSKLGTASAILATIRNLALVVGAGFSTNFFSWRHETTGNYLQALHSTHLLAGLIGVAAMMSALAKESGIVTRAEK